MTAQRRSVRVTDEFFAQLDAQLGPQRGDNGEPSATDFLVLDLPAVVDRFATGFDTLPEIVEGFDAGRMLIATGVLVRSFVVYGLLMSDNSIELLGIELDAPKPTSTISRR